VTSSASESSCVWPNHRSGPRSRDTREFMVCLWWSGVES
jgi:hypothetical protein